MNLSVSSYRKRVLDTRLRGYDKIDEEDMSFPFARESIFY